MSDFWVRKMKTYFQRIDFDKDGAITQKDFEGMADRFVSREKLSDARGKELKGKLLQASTLGCIYTHIQNDRRTITADMSETETVENLKHCITCLDKKLIRR